MVLVMTWVKWICRLMWISRSHSMNSLVQHAPGTALKTLQPILSRVIFHSLPPILKRPSQVHPEMKYYHHKKSTLMAFYTYDTYICLIGQLFLLLPMKLTPQSTILYPKDFDMIRELVSENTHLREELCTAQQEKLILMDQVIIIRIIIYLLDDFFHYSPHFLRQVIIHLLHCTYFPYKFQSPELI